MELIKGRILYSDESQTIVYNKGFLIKLKNETEIARIAIHHGKFKFFSCFRILQRLFRLTPRTVLVTPDNELLVSGNNELLIIDKSFREVKKRLAYRNGMHSPLNIETLKNGAEKHGHYVYGEYFSNDSREPVRIMEYKGDQLTALYSFPENSIRHIHRCISDLEKDRLLILTGDEDQESGIWEMYKNKGEPAPVLLGKQQYRACMAWCVDEKILYVTDTPLEKNYLYEYDETDKILKQVFEIAGPCLYGIQLTIDGEKIIAFSTSVEPDSRLNKIKYHLTRKPSPFIRDDSCHVYIGSINRGFKELISFKKDSLPMGLFQMGNCEFVSDENDRLYLLPTGVKKVDGDSVVFTYSEIKKALNWKE